MINVTVRTCFAEIFSLIRLFALSQDIKCFCKIHLYVSLYTTAIDDYLDEYSYILSGLGDGRDRLFGTK
ncbi:MAG: uracil phosphoribosyltransferase [Nostoc sp.]|uniref:uracil phosphoribosyltransferase n=1 Tax=Nostoc sp. TaxID=1180 RepID=UPI002FF8AB51